MGTSSSSRGPGSGVPFVPPWVPPLPVPLPPPNDDGSVPQPENQDEKSSAGAEAEVNVNPDSPGNDPATGSPPSTGSIDLAPLRRFASTRAALGSFARTGDQESLKRGLGHYVSTGLGGSAKATRRMAGTAINAGNLHGVLEALRTSTAVPGQIDIDPKSLAGKPAREIAERITVALQSADGTQDAEASRDAMSRAFSELIDANGDVDMLALTQDQIEFVTVTYVAEDLCHRVELDVGNAIRDKAKTGPQAIRRLEELKAYIRQEVARCFRTRADKGQRLSSANAASLVAGVIRTTFDVFEEYL